MKKLILMLIFIAFVVQPCLAAFTRSIDNRKTYKNAYRWTNKPRDFILDWAQEVEDRSTGATAIEFVYYSPTDTEPAANEGTVYYDLSEGKLKFRNSSSWVAIEAGSTGNSLDGAYDVGRSITVDAGPVILTTDTGSGIIAMSIDHGGASNNSDGLTIATAGSGDGLQITAEDTDSVGMRVLAGAAQTVSLAVFEGSTSNWDGADDVGMVHINTDDPLIHTGASLLYVVQSGTPIASAEGFLARFVQSGTAQTNATAVEIEVKATQPALAVNGITKINGQNAAGATLFQVIGVGASGNADAASISNTGSGDCLQISPGETDTGGLNMVALAAGVVPLIIVDGVTNDWDGADNKGMINITHDTALIHAGASLLNINQTTAVKSDAEGFLARFVSDATAQASSFAVEIEVTNKQPALKVNNNVTISGADESGELLTITHVGATGNADAMSIASSGSGDALIISPTDVDSGGINVVGKAAGTVPLVILDSATNNWDGADDVGQLDIDNDDAYVHAGASALVITDSSTPISAAEGFLARFVHSGTAQTNSSAVEIEVPATQPALKMNGITVITGQDSPGVALVQIVGNDGSGNLDTLDVHGEGTGDVVQITADDVDSIGLNVLGPAAQTVSSVKIDGTTGAGWTGAAGVGLLNITNDSTTADADATLVNILSTGALAAASDGACLEIEETGAAQATTYAVRIASTSNEALHVDSGVVLVDETIAATGGFITPMETVTATNVITIAEAGKTFILNHTTEFLSTLPTASTATGLTYRFILRLNPTAGNYTISTGNTHENVLYGMVMEAETDTSNDGPTAIAQDLISFIQDIALIGDWVEVTCDGTNWYVSGMTAADGAITFTTQ